MLHFYLRRRSQLTSHKNLLKSVLVVPFGLTQYRKSTHFIVSTVAKKTFYTFFGLKNNNIRCIFWVINNPIHSNLYNSFFHKSSKMRVQLPLNSIRLTMQSHKLNLIIVSIKWALYAICFCYVCFHWFGTIFLSSSYVTYIGGK